ncbi:MAG: glycosyltransferase family 4 protein [Terracidiphilus sp.]|jgi:glycosyltransferase involved in cell wall biosynthesis
MRIAFVSLYEAYPPASGAAYVTFNCARLTPCTSLLVQFSERASIENIANLTIVSLRQHASSRLGKLANMPRAIAQIRREVARFKPDHIVLEGASWAVYLLLLVFVLKMTMPGVRVAYHAHNIEYLIRQQRGNRIIASVTRWAESQILKSCNQSFAVSQDDRHRFSSLYGVLPGLLPNGVDCSAYDATPEEIHSVRHKYGITDESILFMGLYAYPPNTEAVRFLVEQVMPELHSQRPNLRLVVTGGAPPDSPPWLINTGVISRSDLNTVLCACRAGVAPIFKGSGTRLKILEYMAAGLPVVSTKKGAEGLGLEGDKHVLYAETAAEFQVALSRLLSDPSLSKSLSSEAAALVREKFDWAPLLRQFAFQLESQ